MARFRFWRSTANDEELMERVRLDGDERAFAALVRRWERPIHRLCSRMTGDPGRGEELAQETFIRLYEARSAYAPTARFSTYLWRIALNLCRDERRRIERRRACLEDGIIGETFLGTLSVAETPADRHLLDQERAEVVRRAVDDLPEPYRTVVLLRHYEGLKFREIADVLEIPEGTVKSRMAEALTRLARRLKPWIDDEIDPERRTR